MKLCVITCVKEDTPDLISTYDSLLPYLNMDFGWLIKFSQHCTPDFINSIPNHSSIIKLAIPDKSFYSALNQALMSCKSEYFFIFGAGDKLSNTGFEMAIKEFRENPNFSAYFFSTLMLETNQIFKPNPDNFKISMSCPTPSAIFKTKNSIDLNGFSEMYVIASDYDHLCRYLNQYGDYFTSENLLCEFMPGGMSSLRAFEGVLEEELIRIRNFKSNSFAVYGRLLEKISYPITALLRSNFK